MNPNAGQPVGTIEQQTLFANAQSFATSVAGDVAEWERRRTLDRTVFSQAASVGLTSIEVPKNLGGLGLHYRDKVLAAEIISRSSMALAFAITNTHNVAARLADIGSLSHKRDLVPELVAGRRIGSTALTEPGAGSDFGAIRTSASKTPDGWVLNGEKAWITNATVSDVIICYAQTEPGSGPRGIASFLIDGTQPGFARTEPYTLSGGHLIGTAGFRLHDHHVRDEDLLTEPGSGFASALAGVNGARVYVAAMCNAMVRSALEHAVRYGDERQAFGKSLLSHQGLAWSLASVANKLEASTLMTDHAIGMIESGDTSDIILAAAHAKKFATEFAEPAIAACIQAMGAEGLRDHHPLGRHLAEARIANFVDGSTEIQTERIGRSLLSAYQPPVYEFPQATDAAPNPVSD